MNAAAVNEASHTRPDHRGMFCVGTRAISDVNRGLELARKKIEKGRGGHSTTGKFLVEHCAQVPSRALVNDFRQVLSKPVFVGMGNGNDNHRIDAPGPNQSNHARINCEALPVVLIGLEGVLAIVKVDNAVTPLVAVITRR